MIAFGRDTPLIACTVSLALALVLAAPQAVADNGSFVHASDIHFTPFDPPLRARALPGMPIEEWSAYFARDPDQTLSLWGEDTNHALLATALAAIAEAAAGADFALITGDLLAHRFPDNVENALGFAQGSAANGEFAVKTTLFVAGRLRAAMPGKPVILSLGNNDSSCGDYRIEPGGSYLAATRDAVRSLVGPGLVAADFDETYLAGGYYAAAHPTLRDTTIIVLDDIMWSLWYRNSCGTTGLAPAHAMMSWFEKQLATAKAAGRKVWLAHHIPVGFDPYSTLRFRKPTCKASLVSMLAEPFASKFAALLAQYGATITASFTGHTHYDDYRLLRDAVGTVTGTEKIAPAISPIFGQNPGFHVFTYDRTTGALIDFSTRYLANLATARDPASAEWKEEYVFSRAYGVKDFSPASAETVWKAFAAEGSADDTFRRLYNVGKGELAADGLAAYVCAIGHVDAAGFTACYCGK
jgi:sphingomyelin phosphodiesterase acid-like 3